MIEIDTLPQLRDPALVVALTGWVDAGNAGSGSVAFLHEQLDAARTFGRIDLGDLMDLQQTRPTVHLVDGVSREIDWPEITLSAGRLGRDVVLCSGPEPSLRWRAVLGELVDVARQLGIAEVYTVGGIPAMASHRRPVSVLATGTDETVLERAGAWRQDYTGPTGAQSALQVMLGDAGIPTLALWAQVPHYLSGGASPPAIRAVLERLTDLAGLAVDLDGLDDQASTYERRVEEGLTDRPDVVEVIDAIEAGEDEVDESELPSGDELASEIERFLRDQS
ncbi:MAG TPA: PAC2 family protein [Acidimicrobiia bacterium]|nr:PAC2 family protein [Acidimicrobiia bacterium]